MPKIRKDGIQPNHLIRADHLRDIVDALDGTDKDVIIDIAGELSASEAYISGNLDVGGTVTADQFNVTYVSESVLSESGSTQLGNDLTDTHEFTGSILSTGSADFAGPVTFHGTKGIQIGNGPVIDEQFFFFSGSYTGSTIWSGSTHEFIGNHYITGSSYHDGDIFMSPEDQIRGLNDNRFVIESDTNGVGIANIGYWSVANNLYLNANSDNAGPNGRIVFGYGNSNPGGVNWNEMGRWHQGTGLFINNNLVVGASSIPSNHSALFANGELQIRSGSTGVSSGTASLALNSARSDTGVNHKVRIRSVAESASLAGMSLLTQPSNNVSSEALFLDSSQNALFRGDVNVTGQTNFTGSVNFGTTTANRLLSTDGTKNLVSTDIVSWIDGTTNQINIADDGDGTITLSLPQNVHSGANVTFNDLILSSLSSNRLISTDGSDSLTSTDIINWIGGTTNQVNVSDDGDGTITLSLPQNVHSGANVTFNDLTLSSLTANRLISADGTDSLISTDIVSWIDGTANQINVSDDGDGTLTLSLPQDIDSTANPTFNDLTLNGSLYGTGPLNSQTQASASGQAVLAQRTITVTGSNGLQGDTTLNLTSNRTFELQHVDTSTQGNVSTANGDIIGSIDLDTFGHITNIGIRNLDSRYVLESGDTISGDLTITGSLFATEPLNSETQASSSGQAVLAQRQITVSGSTGLTGDTTLDLTSDRLFELQHDNTSDVSDSNNIENDFIQNITFDQFGHVASISSGIADNFYVTGLGFDTATGVFTTTISGSSNQTVDLDGRYGELSNTNTWDSLNTFSSSIAISNSTANRLVATDGTQTLISTSISNWIAGTTNQIVVTDDGDGTLTLNAPQNLHTSADFNIATLTATGGITAGNQATASNQAVLGGRTITISGSNGLTGDTTLDLTSNRTFELQHVDTSTQSNVNTSGGAIIDSIDLDEFGHITSISTRNIDDRYVETTGDSVNGNLAVTGSISTTNALLSDTQANASGEAVLAQRSITVSGSNGLTGNTTLDFTANRTFELQHANTSTQGSSDNSGNTLIQDVFLDQFGHVTGLGTKTFASTDLGNNYLTDLSFDTGNGVLTATVTGSSDVTEDLDGRYALSSGDTFTGNTNFEDYINLVHTAATENSLIWWIDENGNQDWYIGQTNASDELRIARYDATGSFAENPLRLLQDGSVLVEDGNQVWHDGNTTGGTGISVSSGQTITNTDLGSSQNIFKNVASDSGTATADSNNDTVTISGGTDISTSVSGDTLTVNHNDTSTQGSVDNAGSTFIQDVTLDGRGHVTGLASNTLTGGTDISISGTTINHADTSTLSGTTGGSANGIVVEDITVDGRGHVTGIGTVDLDSRFASSGHTHTEADITDLSHYNDENARDAIGTALNGGTDIGISVDDANNTITVNHADTSTQGNVSAPAGGAISDINLDGRGHVTSINTVDFDGRFDNYGSWDLQVNTGTVNSITSGENVNFIGGTNVGISRSGGDVTISSTDTNTTYTAGGGLTLSGTEFSHTDTSTQGNASAPVGGAISDINLDGYGHVTSISTVDFDGRFANTSGDTFTGTADFDGGDANNHGARFLGDKDTSDLPASIMIAHDYDSAQYDVAFEVRGNSTATSINLSATNDDPDTRFVILGSGETMLGYSSLVTNGYSINNLPHGAMLAVNGQIDGNSVTVNGNNTWHDGIGNTLAGSNLSWDGTSLNASDTNTTYSAGSNLSLSGTQFNVVNNPTFAGNITLDSNDAQIYLGAGGNTGPHGIRFYDDDGSTAMNMYYRTSPQELYVEDSGGTELTALDKNGNFTAAGNITWNSDIRLKDDIETVNSNKNTLMGLEGRIYKRNDKDGKTEIGFVAQEVNEILPEAVKVPEDEEKMWSMNTVPITAHLVEGWKDHETRIQELENEIDQLESKIDKLENN